MINLTSQNFDKEVLDAKELVVVDFSAEWCGPCKMLGPIMEDIAKEFESKQGVKFCKIGIDEHTEIAQRFNIMSIPVLKFFQEGKVIHELIGLQSKQNIVDVVAKLIVN